MSNLIKKLKTDNFITTNDLLEYITEKGIDNVYFIIPMKRQGTITPLGVINRLFLFQILFKFCT
jgi:hypothetical protein